MVVRLSWWRQVARALSDMAKQVEGNFNQESWRAYWSMSGLEASFPMQAAMVLRHMRTVYKTRVVCLLFPKMASRRCLEVMMSPSLMTALKRKEVG